MKRLFTATAILVAASAAVFGQQVRVTGQWAIQDGQHNVVSAAHDGKDVDHLGGIGVEVVFDNIGIGVTALASFEETSPDYWFVDWDGRLFMSYHFRDRRAFFDPFIQGGVGSAGEVEIDSNVGMTGDECETKRVAVAIYPYMGAGAGLHFRGGLYASGQFNWRPTGAGIPCTNLDYPDLDEFEAVFAVGFAFN